MRLSVEELAYVRSQGLYITERCDGCGKLLNQFVLYTITGKPEVYCSAACRDFALFRDGREAKKQVNGRKCAYCGAGLNNRKRGALFCGDACRKRLSRTAEAATTAELKKSRTATQCYQ